MYDEVIYWANRLKVAGNVNTSPDTDVLHPTEERLIRTYVKPGSCIMDYGIGGGRTLKLYDDMDLRVVGFDIADFSHLIDKKLEILGNHDLWFKYMYYPKLEKLPYGDNNFDAVVSFSVLTHCRPENVMMVLKEITRLGKFAIISAYDDEPLKITEESYCYLHNYNTLFKEARLKVIETEKVNKMRFWVVHKI